VVRVAEVEAIAPEPHVQLADVLTRLSGPATPHTAHALARLHLACGDTAAAEQSLAPLPPVLGTVRQRVDGAILQPLEDALLAAAPSAAKRATGG
jgi:hypothetical protein